MKRDEKVKFEISREEWIVIGSVSIFAIIWILVVLPNLMTSTWFSTLVPPLQYLLYHIGSILFTFLVFGTPVSYTLKQNVDFWGVIRGGVCSWICLSFIIDMWGGPFAISPEGNFQITEVKTLVMTSVDYMTAWSYINLIHGVDSILISIPFSKPLSLLFILTYFVTPLLAALIMALILKPSKLRSLIGRSIV